MDWRYNTIWFDEIEEKKQLILDCKERSINLFDFANLEYAMIWHFQHKGISFEILPKSNALLYLELNWANIQDLNGIAKYENLKRLDLHYCVKLQNVFGLSSLKNTIEYLHINQSKKFAITEELCQLKKLKVLCLNSCGAIENLQFLEHFPDLIDFRFVDTNILDGDLTPILRHSSIRTVSFTNKRHYNFKDNQIKLELDKLSEPYEDWVSKGDYKTFKYKNYENK